jgi:hypothetical protein
MIKSEGAHLAGGHTFFGAVKCEAALAIARQPAVVVPDPDIAAGIFPKSGGCGRGYAVIAACMRYSSLGAKAGSFPPGLMVPIQVAA